MKCVLILTLVLVLVCGQSNVDQEASFVKAAQFRYLNGDLIKSVSDGGNQDELMNAFENNELGLKHASLFVGGRDGVMFTADLGKFDADQFVWIASASKWLTSATMLRLVDAGLMSLGDHPQKYIDYWSTDVNDVRSNVTLGHLLSFTSGIQSDPVCTGFSNKAKRFTPEECVKEIFETEFQTPGEYFYYSSSHMQVALVMASIATGKNWHEIFDEYTRIPLGMSENTVWNHPSTQNPIIAGGCTSSLNDYKLFLGELFNGTFLSEFAIQQMRNDWTENATFLFSPAEESANQQWHYGQGCWIECHNETWDSKCSSNLVYSSPGAFGFYPWLNFKDMNYGIIAQSSLNELIRNIVIIVIIAIIIIICLIILCCCLRSKKPHKSL